MILLPPNILTARASKHSLRIHYTFRMSDLWGRSSCLQLADTLTSGMASPAGVRRARKPNGTLLAFRIGRADERTRTAYPCSLRVCGQGLLRVAQDCKSRI